MVSRPASRAHVNGFAERNASAIAGVLFVGIVLAAMLADGGTVAAVYVLSFWHYALYALAYLFRRVPHAAFMRDAMAMKTVSLAAFTLVYLAEPLDPLSLAAIGLGLGLNISAALVLGAERTYYGVELGAAAPRRIETFPYSVTAHPMLYGNIAAFAGTLINADFRADWWPLALAHVAANGALLVMELRARPRDSRPRRAWPVTVAFGGALALAGAAWGDIPGAAAAVYGFVIYIIYASPKREPAWRPLAARTTP